MKKLLYLFLIISIIVAVGCHSPGSPPNRIFATNTAQFDSNSDYLNNSTNVIDHNAAYSVLFWFYIDTDINTYTHFYAVNAGNLFAWQNADWVGTDSDGTTVRVSSRVSGSGSTATGTNLSTGTWYHAALVRSSTTSLSLYLDGNSTADATSTTDVTSRTTATNDYVGNLNQAGARCRIFSLKIYNAVLSNARINEEMNCLNVVDNTNLVHFYELQSDFTDSEGDNYTENGTVGFTTGNASIVECVAGSGYHPGRKPQIF